MRYLLILAVFLYVFFTYELVFAERDCDREVLNKNGKIVCKVENDIMAVLRSQVEELNRKEAKDTGTQLFEEVIEVLNQTDKGEA